MQLSTGRRGFGIVYVDFTRSLNSSWGNKVAVPLDGLCCSIAARPMDSSLTLAFGRLKLPFVKAKLEPPLAGTMVLDSFAGKVVGGGHLATEPIDFSALGKEQCSLAKKKGPCRPQGPLQEAKGRGRGQPNSLGQDDRHPLEVASVEAASVVLHRPGGARLAARGQGRRPRLVARGVQEARPGP